jgi:hypothetical protein
MNQCPWTDVVFDTSKRRQISDIYTLYQHSCPLISLFIRGAVSRHSQDTKSTFDVRPWRIVFSIESKP